MMSDISRSFARRRNTAVAMLVIFIASLIVCAVADDNAVLWIGIEMTTVKLALFALMVACVIGQLIVYRCPACRETITNESRWFVLNPAACPRCGVRFSGDT